MHIRFLYEILRRYLFGASFGLYCLCRVSWRVTCSVLLGLAATTTILSQFEVGRFLISGGVATVIYYLCFVPLVAWWNVHYKVASAIGFVPMFFVNFSLQKFWAFQSAHLGTIGQQFALFSIKHGSIFLMNFVLLHLLVEQKRFQPISAQIISTGALTFVSYLLNRLIFNY